MHCFCCLGSGSQKRTQKAGIPDVPEEGQQAFLYDGTPVSASALCRAGCKGAGWNSGRHARKVDGGGRNLDITITVRDMNVEQPVKQAKAMGDEDSLLASAAFLGLSANAPLPLFALSPNHLPLPPNHATRSRLGRLGLKLSNTEATRAMTDFDNSCAKDTPMTAGFGNPSSPHVHVASFAVPL